MRCDPVQPPVSSYTVNNLNQTTTDGTGYTLSYDNNGNRVGKLQSASFFYTYDDENQLISAATDTTAWPVASRWKTDITYDTQGRMRTRKEYTHNGSGWVLGTETRYLYDGRRVIQERNGSNVPQVTYVRGLDLSGSFEGAGGIGGLLSRTAHSGANGATLTHAFYHADANGNITKMVDASQASVADYRYDPFGRTISSSGTLAAANVYQFSSKELMAKSGFYYYGFRFYDPVPQRWQNRDPRSEWGGINLYRYAANNPISRVDPDGLTDWCWPLNGIIYNDGRGRVTGYDWDHNQFYDVGPGQHTPRLTDVDFGKVGGDWYKLKDGHDLVIDKNGKITSPKVQKLDPKNGADKQVIDELEKRLKDRDQKKDKKCD